MLLDVLLASFQVLKRSQQGPRQNLRFPQANLFVRNKLPSILAAISGSSFGLASVEQAITSCWDQVKAELDTPELLACGQHFLYVCSLHHVLTSDVAQQMIEDQELVSGLATRLFSKDDFVSQVNTNPSRVNKLVDELTHADGSTSAISQAIVEVCHLHTPRLVLTNADHHGLLSKQGDTSPEGCRKCHAKESCGYKFPCHIRSSIVLAGSAVHTVG